MDGVGRNSSGFSEWNVLDLHVLHKYFQAKDILVLEGMNETNIFATTCSNVISMMKVEISAQRKRMSNFRMVNLYVRI